MTVTGALDQEPPEAMGDQAPDVLILPRHVEAGRRDTDDSLGTPGRPVDRRSPFFVGFTGTLGVGVAYLFFRVWPTRPVHW